MNETLSLLSTRRSVAPAALREPGPDAGQIETLLRLASRVPDHGKLAPWRFIIFAGEARDAAGEIIARAFSQMEPEAPQTRIDAERKRLSMAPLVVAVVSRASKHPKIPVWEQELSAGAVCMNLLVAATAMGFDASWLTQWYSYDRGVMSRFGLAEDEKLAGFIHIGTGEARPEDRPRPALEDIVTRFGEGETGR
ncbi:MAG: nitroreductase [Beijerinckiaceae bacterium]|jgi:nitroreductase|nr:nitroreductase [Beijerinckiaceae bacterium]